jgi:beta-carotene 3-hydroxylase
MQTILVNAAVFAGAFAAMEAVAWLTHKYIMHGWLWCWHRSHHEPREGLFELNDLFAVIFSLPSIVMIYMGVRVPSPWLWLGLGVMAYGIAYTVFHDGLVHRRFRVPFRGRQRYWRRLVQAHRLHHAVRDRDGAVSFGFLWAPRPQVLKARLLANREAARRPHDRVEHHV